MGLACIIDAQFAPTYKNCRIIETLFSSSVTLVKRLAM